MNMFNLLKKFEDGRVDLPESIVEYLAVQYGPVENVFYVPNEDAASYTSEFRVIHVTTNLLGSGGFKMAVDHKGYIFVSCLNQDDAAKLENKCRAFLFQKIAFRRIREIVRCHIDPADIDGIHNEDNYIEAYDNVRKRRRAESSNIMAK